MTPGSTARPATAVVASARSVPAAASSSGRRRSASATAVASVSMPSSSVAAPVIPSRASWVATATLARSSAPIAALPSITASRAPARPFACLLEVAANGCPCAVGIGRQAVHRRLASRQPILDRFDPGRQLDQRVRSVALEVAQLADPAGLGIEPFLGLGRSSDDLLEHRDAGRIVLRRRIVEPLPDGEGRGKLGLRVADGRTQPDHLLGAVLRLGEVDLLAGVADALVGRDEQRVGLLGQGVRIRRCLDRAAGAGTCRSPRRAAAPNRSPQEEPAAAEQGDRRDGAQPDPAAVPGSAGPAARSDGRDWRRRARQDRRLDDLGPVGGAERFDRRDRRAAVVAIAQPRLERVRDDRVELVVGDGQAVGDPQEVRSVVERDEDERVVDAERVRVRRRPSRSLRPTGRRSSGRTAPRPGRRRPRGSCRSPPGCRPPGPPAPRSGRSRRPRDEGSRRHGRAGTRSMRSSPTVAMTASMVGRRAGNGGFRVTAPES